jgi:integrase
MHEIPFRRKIKQTHFEAMPYDQVPAFFHALSQRNVDVTTARALQFCILTATRTSETLGARWSEIKDNVWTIPAERMKAEVEHRVPLSPQAMVILAQLDRDMPYVFLGRSFSARGQNSLSKKTLLRLMRVMGEKTATVHGFRTSFAMWAQERADAYLETIDTCLAHAIKKKTTRAYARSDVFERRRKLMDWWGNFCDSAETKRPIQHLMLVAD